MKLVFASASEPCPLTYPNKLEITFPKDKIGSDGKWLIQGKAYSSVEDWTIAAQKAALSFGISDFQCYIPEKNSSTNDNISLEFHFKSRLEYLQFSMIVGAPLKDAMTELTVKSPDRYHSQRRERNIHHFAAQYDIPLSTYRLTPNIFKLVTNNLSDLLAIETHLEKGEFDKGRLLSSTKAALLDPEFWPS